MNIIPVSNRVSNKRNKGTPGRQFSPAVTRQPRRATDPPTEQNQLFRWRVNHMDYGGSFSWEEFSVREFCNILVCWLQELETMSWEEVYRKGSHTLSWSSLSPAAYRRFDEIKDQLPETLADADLTSLRVNSVQRIIGLRDRSQFYLLWWDPQHQVSPSSKKHT